jgi:protein-S-isoprenylcysteine O-methyltransferase Ste14
MYLPPPFLYAAALGIGALVERRWPVPIASAELAPSLAILGNALMIAGVGFALWGLVTVILAGTTPLPLLESRALVESGPFRVSRNPMYVGLGAASAGVAIAFNALWPLLALIPAFVALRAVVIANEENYLRQRFGPRYDAYYSRVRRWL